MIQNLVELMLNSIEEAMLINFATTTIHTTSSFPESGDNIMSP